MKEYIAKLNKNYVVLAGIIITALLVFFYVYNRSFIELSINSGDDSYDLILVNSGGQEVRNLSDNSAETVRFFLPRDSYQLSIRSDLASFMGGVESIGLLRTSEYDVQLNNEKSRDIIAVNPLDCIDYDGSIVFSWVCKDVVDVGLIHQPGSQSVPPVSERLFGYGGAAIYASFTFEGTLFVLVRSSTESESGEAVYAVYPLTSEGRIDISNGRILDDLARDGLYYAKSYRDGFLVFNSEGSDVFYYDSPYENPETLSAFGSGDSEDTTSNLHSVSISGDKVVFAHTNAGVPEYQRGSQYLGQQYISDDGVFTREDTTTVKIYDYTSKEVRRYEIGESLEQIRFCGENRLCSNTSGILRIYEVKENGIEKIAQLPKILQIEASPRANHIYVVNDIGVAEIDTENMSGSYVYTNPEDFSFCGLRNNGNNLLVCTQDSDGRSYALLVSTEEIDHVPVDRFVRDLSSTFAVASVSPYKHYIHVLGEYGNPEQTPQGFFLNEETVARVNRQIKEMFDSSGLAEQDYQLILTVD